MEFGWLHCRMTNFGILQLDEFEIDGNSLLCDLLLATFYTRLMIGGRKYHGLHEICIGKKLVVCSFIMMQKLVVGRFFILKKLVGLML